MDEKDIYLSAKLLIDQSGTGAPVHAAMRIDALIEAEGLREPIAVAPQVAALVFRMIRLSFEGGWIVGGKSDLTFRRPVGVHDFCVAKGTVVEKMPEAGGKTRVVCEVSVETEKGVQAIVGKCSGVVG